MLSLSLQLSEEPNLGKWKITVKENVKRKFEKKAQFEVKKFVLPKFEFKVDAPNYIFKKDKGFSFKACAK